MITFSQFIFENSRKINLSDNDRINILKDYHHKKKAAVKTDTPFKYKEWASADTDKYPHASGYSRKTLKREVYAHVERLRPHIEHQLGEPLITPKDSYKGIKGIKRPSAISKQFIFDDDPSPEERDRRHKELANRVLDPKDPLTLDHVSASHGVSRGTASKIFAKALDQKSFSIREYRPKLDDNKLTTILHHALQGKTSSEISNVEGVNMNGKAVSGVLERWKKGNYRHIQLPNAMSHEEAIEKHNALAAKNKVAGSSAKAVLANIARWDTNPEEDDNRAHHIITHVLFNNASFKNVPRFKHKSGKLEIITRGKVNQVMNKWKAGHYDHLDIGINHDDARSAYLERNSRSTKTGMRLRKTIKSTSLLRKRD